MISLTDRGYQQSITALEKIREEWLKEHIKACEVNTTNFLHVALWSSGCPPPFRRAWGQSRRAFCSVFPHRTTAGRVAGNPARFSCLVSGFKVAPLQSFHCAIFNFFHRLLKLTESTCSVVTFFSCFLLACLVLPPPGSVVAWT